MSKIKDLLSKYLKTEETIATDIALPADKAATKTPAGRASKKRKKLKKENTDKQ